MSERFEARYAVDQQQELAKTVGPLVTRNVVGQADAILARTERGLAMARRPLLMADQPQRVAAAHAIQAGNEAVVMDAISRQLLSPQPAVIDDLRYGTLRHGDVSRFLAGRYETAERSIAVARAITDGNRFGAAEQEAAFSGANSVTTRPLWPAATPPSRYMTRGLESGLAVVETRTLDRLAATVADESLPDAAARTVSDRAAPLVQAIYTGHDRYQHITDGSVLGMPRQDLPEAYHELTIIARHLGELSLQLAPPEQEALPANPVRAIEAAPLELGPDSIPLPDWAEEE